MAECDAERPQDLDGGGDVDATDLADLLTAWSPNPGHEVDFNGDGTLDAADLAEMLADWGACP